jgi:hypothetical protein
VEVTGRGTDHPELAHHLHRQIDRWRKRNRFYHTLRETQHQDAFNHLLRVRGHESAAMSNASTSCMMDILNLIANVHANRCLEDLREQVTDVALRLRALEHGQTP